MKFWMMACMAAVTCFAVAEMPKVEDAIPPAVKALEAPVDVVFPNGIEMAVTASNDKAQAQVLQGLNHLHGGWEFQASRHFAAAMREDPECLLAHWGLVMCLLSPDPEAIPARNALVERLLELVDLNIGSELERGYAYALIKYMEEGPVGAMNAFIKVSDKFPNDIQSKVFGALFGRTGYDELGGPTPGQERSEKVLAELVEKFPEDPLPLNALLLIKAEAPDLTGSLEAARKLSQMSPSYAPYFHLLGHYEWRCGNHGNATAAFGRASSLFERWMTENKATVADCPEWANAECYRVVALCSKGDFDTAYAAAKLVANIPFPAERGTSNGARFLLWEAKTLPARLLMRRGLPADLEEALASLPKPADVGPTSAKSLAFWWIDGLRMFLDARRWLAEGKYEEARQTAAALNFHGDRMSRVQNTANLTGERSAWSRAFRSMEVIASELSGEISLAGPVAGRGAAFNWFRAAADRQQNATMLYPPALLMPMAAQLGEYYMGIHKTPEAIAAFNEALKAFPNDIQTLKSLEKAHRKDENAVEADKIAAQIKLLEEQ